MLLKTNNKRIGGQSANYLLKLKTYEAYTTDNSAENLKR